MSAINASSCLNHPNFTPEIRNIFSVSSSFFGRHKHLGPTYFIMAVQTSAMTADVVYIDSYTKDIICHTQQYSVNSTFLLAGSALLLGDVGFCEM